MDIHRDARRTTYRAGLTAPPAPTLATGVGEDGLQPAGRTAPRRADAVVRAQVDVNDLIRVGILAAPLASALKLVGNLGTYNSIGGVLGLVASCWIAIVVRQQLT